MADTVKSLRKANDALKDQLNEFAKEMLSMKAKIDKHGPPLQPSAADLEEQVKGCSISVMNMTTSNRSKVQQKRN